LAVIAILTVLSGIVAGAVTGIGASGQNARLTGDADTIGKAADRFFNDAFPQSYPVLTCCASGNLTPSDILVAGDLGVRLVDFEAVLPGNPTKSFVPDFLKETPDTAALVSWRIVTASGQVFFAQDGAQLVRPSAARLDVSGLPATQGVTGAATGNIISAQEDYKFTLRLNKNESAPTILGISIPAGYAIGGQGLAAAVKVGTVTVTISTDNPWKAGKALSFTGDLEATGVPNEWTLKVFYSGAGTTALLDDGGVTRADRTHKVSIATPSEESAGALKLVLKTCGDALVAGKEVCDKAHNEATETWELTIYGVPPTSTGTNVITNPPVKGVYRWLAVQHTSIDVTDLFSSLTGNQAVVIKASTTSEPGT
jgi:hypothetical protein